jgi:hypothetical protein
MSNVEKFNDLVENFSTLKPTVGTICCTLNSGGFRKLTIEDLPLLSKPIINRLISFRFTLRNPLILSKSPIFFEFLNKEKINKSGKKKSITKGSKVFARINACIHHPTRNYNKITYLELFRPSTVVMEIEILRF